LKKKIKKRKTKEEINLGKKKKKKDAKPKNIWGEKQKQCGGGGT
jgi:hypothetical protein